MEDSLITVFHTIYHTFPEVFSSAPGRINLIGEHTDYNKGYVLPAAIHYRNYFLAARTRQKKVCVFTKNFNDRESFDLDEMLISGKKKWMNYVKGIFWALEQEGLDLEGVNICLFSDIPLEAGLSSSAALEISLLTGLNALFRLDLTTTVMALLAQKAENEFVGVQSGLMDQYVSLFAQQDRALFLDCETFAFEHIPLKLKENGLSLLIYESGVRRDLVSSAYNQRREEAAAALEFLKKPEIRCYKDVSVEMLEGKKQEMGEILFRRARHVVSENERVKKAVEALRKYDFERFGDLLFRSHESLKDDYQVSCPELDLLYEVGMEFPGCLGARLTGAGFGGAGIALVKENQKEAFIKEVFRRSKEKGFARPHVHQVKIGQGARIHHLGG